MAPHMYEPHYNFAALADQVRLCFIEHKMKKNLALISLCKDELSFKFSLPMVLGEACLIAQ